MVHITSLTVEGLEEGLVTDSPNPKFAFSYDGDGDDPSFAKAIYQINGETIETTSMFPISYKGKDLLPFTKYTVDLLVETKDGQKAQAQTSFETGFIGKSWKGKWISDSSYIFKEKKVSPKVMSFRRKIKIDKEVKRAVLYSTVLGVYDVLLDGKRIFNRYFAPGFTSYEHRLQYQVTDLTGLLRNDSVIQFNVAGGWAVGSFVMNRSNRIYADKQSLRCEIHLEYIDGSKEIIPSDESFEVTTSTPYLLADFYDGETYDARVGFSAFHKASFERVKIHPELIAEEGSPVKVIGTLNPLEIKKQPYGSFIYDFKQNFAGILSLKILKAKEGQEIIIKHGEILKENGDVNMSLLRSAKQTLTYVCREGEQVYEPTFTYMGFRYIQVYGIDPEDIRIEGKVLSSCKKPSGEFSCDDEMINKLQKNILWSSYSNFMDIPTDCPQRDERMGWTGDIALFSPTALYNFDLIRFLEKWIKDVKAEQRKSGAIPTTIPHKGYGFPETFPTTAVDFWGDVILLVPYQIYKSTGDISILKDCYKAMVKYVDDCLWWAKFLSFGKNRYIWKSLNMIHFGDWVAPRKSMAVCQGRHPYTATASLYNTTSLLAKISKILGKDEEAEKYETISKKVSSAYEEVLLTKEGKIKGEEFQTGYVLPIAFGMLSPEMKDKVEKNFVELVKKDNFTVQTGFPGTPFLLEALVMSGHKDLALKVLLNEKCPSWLHEVKEGATTIWERFDGINEKGELDVPEDGTGGMISFNHYASGAIGLFLYERVLGLRMTSPCYQTFEINPLFTEAFHEAQGKVKTPFGEIRVHWKVENNKIHYDIHVPLNCKAIVVFPNKEIQLERGDYSLDE